MEKSTKKYMAVAWYKDGTSAVFWADTEEEHLEQFRAYLESGNRGSWLAFRSTGDIVEMVPTYSAN